MATPPDAFDSADLIAVALDLLEAVPEGEQAAFAAWVMLVARKS